MRIKGLGIALCALVLAGCGSPESSIKDSCVRDGGLGHDKTAAGEVIAKQCGCFSEQLKASLSDAQLKLVADMMKMPEKDREAAAKAMPMTTMTAVMGAAKSCVAAH